MAERADFDAAIRAMKGHGNVTVSDVYPRGVRPCRTARIGLRIQSSETASALQSMAHLCELHGCAVTAERFERDGKRFVIVTAVIARDLEPDEIDADRRSP